MSRKSIRLLYIQEEIQQAIRYNHQRDSYWLSLPYEIVWEHEPLPFNYSNPNEVERFKIEEHQVGVVNLYGFNTVYNPDESIGLVKRYDWVLSDNESPDNC